MELKHKLAIAFGVLIAIGFYALSEATGSDKLFNILSGSFCITAGLVALGTVLRYWQKTEAYSKLLTGGVGITAIFVGIVILLL